MIYDLRFTIYAVSALRAGGSVFHAANPAQHFGSDATPLGLGIFQTRIPGVAPPSQPWAEGHNPFGIEKHETTTFGRLGLTVAREIRGRKSEVEFVAIGNLKS
jgi:hypothetical protein